MAILEEEVLVKLVGNNMNYYSNKGYKLPMVKNVNGKMVVPFKSEIKVKVEDLPKGSDVRLTKICDVCTKKSYNKTYYEICNSRKKGDGKDRCFECGKQKAKETLLNRIKYENSLEYYAKENNKAYLIEEYSTKNKKRSNEISSKSGLKYLWNCNKCTSEYEATAASRTNLNSNCPFCSGKKVNETNCLWSTRPEIAFLLKNKERGYELTAGSNKMEYFLCPNCNYEQKKLVNDISRNGLKCSNCSDGISYGEKFITSLLNQLNIPFEREVSFGWLEQRRYDFYIKEINCIIEVHGAQHYEGGFKSYGGRSLEEEQENDNLKLCSAIKNGLSNYIIIDCRKSSFEYIKDSILSSNLVNLFDLNLVDWNICHEFAINFNQTKQISDLWNAGIKSSVEIGKVVKLERSAVVRYLKQASKLLWCDYDSINVKKIRIVQLSLLGDLIKIWDSACDAGRKLGIPNSSISAVCRGKRKSTGGYKWMTAEKYFNENNGKINIK